MDGAIIVRKSLPELLELLPSAGPGRRAQLDNTLGSTLMKRRMSPIWAVVEMNSNAVGLTEVVRRSTMAVSAAGRMGHSSSNPSTLIQAVMSRIASTSAAWRASHGVPASRCFTSVRRSASSPRRVSVSTPGRSADVDVSDLPLMARTMVGVAMLTGLRRGELFGLRWKALDLNDKHLTVQEAVYEGAFGTPKTGAGARRIPLSDLAVGLLAEWNRQAKKTEPEDLVFSTWSGKPISPNNILRRWVFPACTKLGLPRATWLTFRRTYSSWAHDKGVPGKVVAELMGHVNVDTTLNVYTQVIDASLRSAAEKIGGELFTIVHNAKPATELSR